MSVALALYLLATADAAFCGYRAAAGRNGLIGKRRYYERAMLRGALWGQAAVALAAAALLLFALLEPDPADAWRRSIAAGRRMLDVYLPYAALIVLGFAARALPSVDVRSLTSSLVFGPLTLLRPLVAVTGVAWAAGASRSAELVAVGVLVLVLMLSMEWFLSRHYRAAPEPSVPTGG